MICVSKSVPGQRVDINGGFLSLQGSCTAHLMHHRVPGLRLETAPCPIFGPMWASRSLTIQIFYLVSHPYSFLLHCPCPPCLSMILYYTIDAHASVPNGRMALLGADYDLTWQLPTIATRWFLHPRVLDCFTLFHRFSCGRRVSLYLQI